MSKQVHWAIVGTVLIAAAGWFLPHAAAQGKPAKDSASFLPGGVYKELVRRALRVIDEGRAQPLPDEKMRRSALLLAAYTYGVKDDVDPRQTAALREGALKLAEILLNDRRYKEAQKLAANLARLPIAPEARRPFTPRFQAEDLWDLQGVFKTLEKNGAGLPRALQIDVRLKRKSNGSEEYLAVLARKRQSPTSLREQSRELTLLAYQTAAVGEMSGRIFKQRQTNPQAFWQGWSQEMRDAALELAVAAQESDADAVFAAARTLYDSCLNCHRGIGVGGGPPPPPRKK
jgi:hypothetical protein